MFRKLVRLAVLMGLTSALGGAAVATGATAYAGGGFSCSNVQSVGINTVVCTGDITVLGQSAPVQVTVGDVQVLSGNDISVLENSLNNDSVNLANLDVQTQLDQIQVDVLDVFNNQLAIPIQICQIKVVEIGVVNNNQADCQQN